MPMSLMHIKNIINLPLGGPIDSKSVALDRFNQGSYLGAIDRRILKYQGSMIGFLVNLLLLLRIGIKFFIIQLSGYAPKYCKSNR